MSFLYRPVKSAPTRSLAEFDRTECVTLKIMWAPPKGGVVKRLTLDSFSCPKYQTMSLTRSWNLNFNNNSICWWGWRFLHILLLSYGFTAWLAVRANHPFRTNRFLTASTIQTGALYFRQLLHVDFWVWRENVEHHILHWCFIICGCVMSSCSF